MKTENTQHLEDKAEVLIALAAQQSEPVEQSPSPEELADFFANSRRFSKDRQEQILAYLDSNPQAYERWIKQGKAAEQSRRSASFKLLMNPYAIAIYALLLMIGAGLLWRGQAFELDQAINKSYQVAAFDSDSEDAHQTMMSWSAERQQTKRSLSFSQSGKSSDLAKAFSIGLQHDWQEFGEETVESVRRINAKQEDYQLGRWYTLLWMVSQQNRVMSTDFWHVQLKILDHLRTHYTDFEEATDATEVRAVVLQLERMQAILQQLVEDNQDVRFYRKLDKVLSALRYSLIP